MPDLGTNFKLTLDTQASITSVLFDDPVLTSATNFDAVPITITTSDADIVKMKIYNCKGFTHKDFTAEADQTTFTYESVATVISSPLEAVIVKIDGEEPSASYTIDTITTAGVVSITPAPGAGKVITVRYEKIVLGQNEAEWQDYNATPTIKLDKATVSTAGTVTVYVKLQDDVFNETEFIASNAVPVDTALPELVIDTIVCPVTTVDGYKISKQPSRDTITITFHPSTENIVQWAALVVSASTDLYADGTAIPETAGSTTGETTNYSVDDPITCIIKGADYETALGGTGHDGEHTIKLFVKDSAGNWSVD